MTPISPLNYSSKRNWSSKTWPRWPRATASFNIGDRGDGAGFAGRIDEVAVYTGVLSPTRIQAHYAAASAAQPPKITFTRSAGNIILSWPTGVLYQADDLTAAFTKVTGASSPYTVTPAGAKKFFLLQAQ